MRKQLERHFNSAHELTFFRGDYIAFHWLDLYIKARARLEGQNVLYAPAGRDRLTMAEVSVVVCSYCDFQCYNQVSLMKHLKNTHANDPNFRVHCIFCDNSFKKWDTLKKHLQRDRKGKTVALCLQSL